MKHFILRESAPLSHHIIQLLDCQCPRFLMTMVEVKSEPYCFCGTTRAAIFTRKYRFHTVKLCSIGFYLPS
uniref:Uncharacterized protein n=1 Tax=Triticum urartu TaxID=4572 RepID=A0A8R7PQW6_TRIUA